MTHPSYQKRLYGTIFVIGAGIFLLVATATLLLAAVHNWSFTTASDYTFDATKVEVSDDLAKLEPITVIHNEAEEFTGTYSSTLWATDHIELDGTGLNTGSGSYTSQIIDSGMAEVEWGKITWTEVLAQDSAGFSPTQSVWGGSSGYSVYGTDIDGDDDVDVISVQSKGPRTSYFENDGTETFTSRTINNGQLKDARDLQGADINLDGLPDLVVVARSGLAWFENLGGSPVAWNKWDIAPKPSGGLELELADVNNNGSIDVVVGDETSLQWYENNGVNPPDWTVHEVDNTLSAVDAVSVGDMDADGDLDLLAGGDTGLYWYENNGANPPEFTRHELDNTVVNAESIVTADFDNDGKLDIVGLGLGSLSLYWYQNNGSIPPNFTKHTIDNGPLTSPVSVAAGDLDRDGDVDLVLVDNADVHWYQNQGGALPTWTKSTLTTGNVLEGDHVFLVNLEDDVNGDDDFDILLTEKNQVSWWENLMPHSNLRFQLRTSADATIWSPWQGPGGRATSSYTDPMGETITVPSGQYIQYRVFFRTHNGTILNPQLSMVRLEPVATSYPTNNPTVQNVTGQEYASISSFSETLGVNNQGQVKYQISNDGSVWYYHNGSLWVPAAQGFNHANNAAEVDARISTFPLDVGPGTFYFKAFLHSNGIEPVELDQVDVDLSTGGSAGGSGTGSSGPGSGSGGSGAGSGGSASGSGSEETPLAKIAWLSGTQTTNGTNINQSPGVTIEWNSSTFDSNYFSHSTVTSPERLSIKTAGDYLVAVTLPMSGTKARTAVQAEIWVNGTPADGAIGDSSYVRKSSGHNESSDHIAVLLTNLAVDDTIEVFVTRMAATGAVTIDGQASLYAEHISPRRTVFSATATQTTDSTNLNQTAAYALQWAGDRKDQGFTHSNSVNPEKITVDEAGDYLVFVNIPLTGSLTRGNVKLLVQADGVTVAGGEGKQGYIRNASGHNHSSIHWSGLITGVDAGSDITIATQREGGSGTMSIPAGNMASLYMEKLDSGNNVFFAKGNTLIGGNNWNPTTPQPIQWANTDIIDSALFRHSIATNPHEIAIRRSGDYLLIYNDSLTAAGSRPNVRVTVEVNGSAKAGAETKSHYIRNASGHTESSGSLVYLLKDLVVNDIITVSAAREAGSPTVNDDQDALLMLWFKRDIAAPLLASATVNSRSLVLTYTDANGLDPTSTPDPTDFSIGTDGVSQAVMGVAMDSDKVVLTLAPGVADADFITVSYTAGAKPLQDLMANLAVNQVDQPVVNMTPRLVFVIQPGDGTSGWAFDPPPVVEVRDGSGNPITVDPDSSTGETVTLAMTTGSNEGGATLSGNATAYIDWSTGRATFPDLSTDLVGSYQLTASTSFVASTVYSTEFSINAGPPAQLIYRVQPSNGVSTERVSPAMEVQVEDAAGNLVGTATDPVTLALGSNSGHGTLSGTLTVSAVKGIAIFSDFSVDKVGSRYTLEATAYGLAHATSAGFDITVGPPTKLVYGVEPNHAVSTEAISPAINIQIQDRGGNLVPTAPAPITLSIKDNPSNGNLSGTSTVQAVGGVATFQDLSIDKKGNGYSLEVSAPGLASVVSQGFNVVASDDPIQLSFNVGPSDTESEVAISPSITVQVLDAGGNLIESATTPITLAIKDNPSNGILTETLTVMAKGGEATFSNLSIDKAGDGYTLFASATSLNSATSESFSIRPGDAFQLAFVAHPENGQSQKAIPPLIRVQVQDAAGNLVVTSTHPITLAIEDNPGNGTLSGMLTVTAGGGEATFSDLSIDRARNGYRLVASVPGLEFAMSGRFSIRAGEATQLVFIGQPGNGASHETRSPAIKVQIRDAAGNLVDTSTVPIHLAIQKNPGGGTLAGTLMVLVEGGEGTFNDISIDKVGDNYTLVASASGLDSVTSGNFNIEAGNATQLVFGVHPVDAESQAVISPAIKVQVQDAWGNLVTTATDSILLLINDNPGGGTLSGTLMVNAKGGEAVFDNVSIDKATTGYSLLAGASGLISTSSQAFAITEKEEPVEGGGRSVFVSISAWDIEVVVESAKEGKGDDPSAGIQDQEVPVIADQADRPISDSGTEVVYASPPNAETSVIRDDSRAGLLNRETVVAGKSVTIRYRAASGLSPKIDVYDARRMRQIAADPMREIGTTGVYEYHLALETAWGLGEFTIIASESEKGTLNWMTLTVVETRGADFTLVKTDAITVPALLAAVQTKLESVQTNLNNADGAPESTLGLDPEGSEVNPQNPVLERIHASMREISKLLKPVSNANGINLDHYYRSIDEPTLDVDKLREKAEKLRILLELNRELADKGPQGVKEPVTKTWFESGSVILKILIVNPSQTERQAIPVKVYLPKEVTPEDIIYLEDLELGYDPEKGMYYAHKEVELGPGQSITKMVRMEDIWVFPEEQLTTYVNQAREIANELGQTTFAEEGAAFLLAIESKVQEILETQQETVSNAEAHIQAYREATTLIFSIKNDLSALDQYRQRAVEVHSESESAMPDGSQTRVEETRESPPEDQGAEQDELE